MSEFKRVQIYLKTPARKMQKILNKVSNPESYQYGKYRNFPIALEDEVAEVLGKLTAFPGVEICSTYFPDVLSTKLSKEARSICRREGWIFTERESNTFRHVTSIFKSLEITDGVATLPYIPSMTEPLKKRVHFECMKLGLMGITLIAPMDSAWAEIPSVLVVAPPTKLCITSTFSRKKDAFYQHYHVTTYFRDPEVKLAARKQGLDFTGRASPDIYEEDMDQIVTFLQDMNQERKKKNRPLLGFVNPLFYQTAHGFFRNDLENQSGLPDSTTFWRAHVGLGKPNYEKLKEEILEQ